MVIFFLSLAASLGKYAFRIQNAYQLIDCSKENGDAVVYIQVDMVEDKIPLNSFVNQTRG